MDEVKQSAALRWVEEQIGFTEEYAKRNGRDGYELIRLDALKTCRESLLSPSPSPSLSVHPNEVAFVEKAVTEALAELDKLGQPHRVGCNLAAAWGILKGRLQQQTQTIALRGGPTILEQLADLQTRMDTLRGDMFNLGMTDYSARLRKMLEGIRSIGDDLTEGGIDTDEPTPTGVHQENGGDKQ